jgi:hypothetical protein
MAILEKKVQISVGRNVAYLENKGYEIPKEEDRWGRLRIPRGTKIEIMVEDLYEGSNARVTKKCDDCGKETRNLLYYQILELRKMGDGKDRCYHCGNEVKREKQKLKIKNDRIGLANKNKFGTEMTVIDYENFHNVTVEFEDGHIVHTNWGSFIKGSTINPYDRKIYGVGYLGEGSYKTNVTINGKHKHSAAYTAWYDMLKRCYCEKYLLKFPTYRGCSVTEEWHNFQVFAKWHEDNFYRVGDTPMELDKDILVKGNKIYSPATCIYVPYKINYMFLRRKKVRGILPIGVYFEKECKRYIAQCHDIFLDKTKALSSYGDPIAAFRAYKDYKENIIKKVANMYKNDIPEVLYTSLMNYKVEIND